MQNYPRRFVLHAHQPVTHCLKPLKTNGLNCDTFFKRLRGKARLSVDFKFLYKSIKPFLLFYSKSGCMGEYLQVFGLSLFIRAHLRSSPLSVPRITSHHKGTFKEREEDACFLFCMILHGLHVLLNVAVSMLLTHGMAKLEATAQKSAQRPPSFPPGCGNTL